MVICSLSFIDSSGLVLYAIFCKILSGTSSSEAEDDEHVLDLEEDKDDRVDRLNELGLAVVALLNVAATS